MTRFISALMLLTLACASIPQAPLAPTPEEIERQKLDDMIGCMQVCIMGAKTRGVLKTYALLQLCSSSCVCIVDDCTLVAGR